MRYVKSRIFTVTNIHSGHVTMAAIETILVWSPARGLGDRD